MINDIIMGVDCNYVYGIVSLTPPKTLGFIIRIHIKKNYLFTLKIIEEIRTISILEGRKYCIIKIETRPRLTV